MMTFQRIRLLKNVIEDWVDENLDLFVEEDEKRRVKELKE